LASSNRVVRGYEVVYSRALENNSVEIVVIHLQAFHELVDFKFGAKGCTAAYDAGDVDSWARPIGLESAVRVLGNAAFAVEQVPVVYDVSTNKFYLLVPDRV